MRLQCSLTLILLELGHVGPVVSHSPADWEVRDSIPTLVLREFLRAQEMNLKAALPKLVTFFNWKWLVFATSIEPG